MNELGSMNSADRRVSRTVFVSYATADRKQALSVCKSIERRGTTCWISSRDVAPGENYQEAIVRSLRDARAMVLVFSKAANNSDEIKKELSLASRFRVPVMALRIEDVEPSDAFAYELSTRQWIDAFDGWDHSIDSLVGRIEQVSGAGSGIPAAATAAPGRTRSSRRPIAIAAALSVLLLVVIAGAWRWLRQPSAAAHSMMVRLAKFDSLSTDLPATLPQAVGAEIIAAFNADGVIGVSTVSAPPGGPEPAYALGGSIDRVGDSVRVISRLTNERTGVVLWSDSVDYPAAEVSRIPHHIAVDAGTIVRCGLFGASTYHKSLPDPVLGNYMQYCQQYWSYGGNKTLIAARRVAAALPDFSWGWSAVANGYIQSRSGEHDRARAEEMRVAGLQAEDKALALDPTNSEALAHKAYLIGMHDWADQEALFRRAIAAKPLDCGCEHYGYGLMLNSVGRLADSIGQFGAATDMLALWPDSQVALAQVLLGVGKVGEARPRIDAAIALSPDSQFGQWLALNQGVESGDYAAAIAALRNPQLQLPEGTRAAVLSGYQALASGDRPANSKAVRALLALPEEEQDQTVAAMLGALGADQDALRIANRIAATQLYGGPSIFWYRSMRRTLDDPRFPAVAAQLGLMRYWKSTQTRPDVCKEKAPPPFCRMI